MEVWVSELDAPSASVAASNSRVIRLAWGWTGNGGVRQGEDEGVEWRVKSVLRKITALDPCLSAR